MAVTTTQSHDQIWFTRRPEPSAMGIAAELGWLQDEFASDGISVHSSNELTSERRQARYPADGLRAFFRDDGSVPALWSRSRGSGSRLIGLTWDGEGEAIVTRESFGLASPRHMLGARLAVPERGGLGADFRRAEALHGYAVALGIARLTLDDIKLVEVPGDDPIAELSALRRGVVDAVYVRGESALVTAPELGTRVLVGLDATRRNASGLGNPPVRPITVDQRVLDERPDIVARFLAVLLRVAEPAESSRAAVPSLHPDLSSERLGILQAQADLLLAQGFIDHHVDVAQWADSTPLTVARDLLAGREAALAISGVAPRGVRTTQLGGRAV